MKDEELYLEYLEYLNWKMNNKQINKGKYSLLKMSRNSFEDFKVRLENDITFNDMIVEIMRIEARDKKIDNIFDDID
jgi:hypothetical protein